MGLEKALRATSWSEGRWQRGDKESHHLSRNNIEKKILLNPRHLSNTGHSTSIYNIQCNYKDNLWFLRARHGRVCILKQRRYAIHRDTLVNIESHTWWRLQKTVKALGRCLMGKVPVTQVWVPEFDPQHTCKNMDTVAHVCAQCWEVRLGGSLDLTGQPV